MLKETSYMWYIPKDIVDEDELHMIKILVEKGEIKRKRLAEILEEKQKITGMKLIEKD